MSEDLREFEALTELEELRRINSGLQAKLRRAQASKDDLVHAAREGARQAAVILGNPPPVEAPPRDKRRGKPEVAILHLSDWQLGKVTESYSSDVALKRIEQLGHKLVRLTEIERADHPVRECHIFLGGDLAENASIFRGQSHEIDSGLFRQVFNCIGAVERTVRLALSVFDRVHVWVVKGNHGRLGRDGEHPREDNADLFISEEAYERLARTEGAAINRLVWHAPKHWYAVATIGNYGALLVHGDQIKQFGGNTPAFGIGRKVNAWAAGVIKGNWVDCYMGHFHQPLVIPMPEGHRRTFINPSIESDSAYAQEFVAATGSPGQRLNFVDPERGRVTTERILWLD